MAFEYTDKRLCEIDLLKKLIDQGFFKYEREEEKYSISEFFKKKIIEVRAGTYFPIISKSKLQEILQEYLALEHKIDNRESLSPREIRFLITRKIILPHLNYGKKAPSNLKNFSLELSKNIIKIATEELGYTLLSSKNKISSSIKNFDSLFLPLNHVVRETHDTYYTDRENFILKEKITGGKISVKEKRALYQRIKKEFVGGLSILSGWGNYEKRDSPLLRTHLTRDVFEKRLLLGKSAPKKILMIEKVYRNEKIDATHSDEFTQVELNIADREYTLERFISECIYLLNRLGISSEIKVGSTFYQYTKRSFELTSSELEIMGGGQFIREISNIYKIEGPSFGGAFGLERIAMALYSIKDHRKL